jgi:hypothetical protein
VVDLLPMGTPPLVPARRLVAKPHRGLRNMRGADLGTLGTEESAGAPERRPMIAMTSRLSLTLGSPRFCTLRCHS